MPSSFLFSFPIPVLEQVPAGSRCLQAPPGSEYWCQGLFRKTSDKEGCLFLGEGAGGDRTQRGRVRFWNQVPLVLRVLLLNSFSTCARKAVVTSPKSDLHVWEMSRWLLAKKTILVFTPWRFPVARTPVRCTVKVNPSDCPVSVSGKDELISGDLDKWLQTAVRIVL